MTCKRILQCRASQFTNIVKAKVWLISQYLRTVNTFTVRRYWDSYSACDLKHIHCSQILRYQSHLGLYYISKLWSATLQYCFSSFTVLAIWNTFTVRRYWDISHTLASTILVNCEARHCNIVFQVLFGVKTTFSILQIQNFPWWSNKQGCWYIVFHCLKNVKLDDCYKPQVADKFSD